MVEEKKVPKKILILAGREDEQFASITFELLRAGRELSDQIGGGLCVALLGHKIGHLSNEMAHFVDRVYSLDHPLLAGFRPEPYALALKQLCEKVNPEAVLLGHTIDNLNLAPRLAYHFGVEVITDCTQLTLESGTGHLLCTKPVYGAKFLSTFRLEKRPFIITLRSKAVEPIEEGHSKGEVVCFDPIIDESFVRVKLVEKIKEDGIRLDKAEAIVSGGRGIRNAEGLDQLKALVKVLGRYFNQVELGASRPLVDARLVPSLRQIGLTGEKVAPVLYIAVGISGSLQHVTGISGAKKIVAINTDPKAHIFEVSDYGVVGRFEEVVPVLIRKLEEST